MLVVPAAAVVGDRLLGCNGAVNYCGETIRAVVVVVRVYPSLCIVVAGTSSTQQSRCADRQLHQTLLIC